MVVSSDTFEKILTRLINLENEFKKVNSYVSDLQNMVNSLQSSIRSRNVSSIEETSAEVRSLKIGRKSHEEMLKELGIAEDGNRGKSKVT